jgi:hypothetical protein
MRSGCSQKTSSATQKERCTICSSSARASHYNVARNYGSAQSASKNKFLLRLYKKVSRNELLQLIAKQFYFAPRTLAML